MVEAEAVTAKITVRNLRPGNLRVVSRRETPMSCVRPKNLSSRCKAAILLGVVIFFSFIYFYEGGGWNQNSRFDLLRAIVERHTLQIDAYHENTQDKAHFQGHYYSDKAPGLVFLARAVCAGRTACVADCRSRSGIGARRGCAVVLGERLARLRCRRRWRECACFFWRCDSEAARSGAAFGDGGDVPGHSDLGVCEFVLGACSGGSLPALCVCVGAEGARERERSARRFSLGAGRGTGGGMGDGYGISGGTGFGDAGILGAVAGMAARQCCALARDRWCGLGRWRFAWLCCCGICTRRLGRFVRAIPTTIRIRFRSCSSRDTWD